VTNWDGNRLRGNFYAFQVGTDEWSIECNNLVVVALPPHGGGAGEVGPGDDHDLTAGGGSGADAEGGETDTDSRRATRASHLTQMDSNIFDSSRVVGSRTCVVEGLSGY